MRVTAAGYFAAVLLTIDGTLNVVYGIGAISNSSFFPSHSNYIFGSLSTWGWISVVLGAVELAAAVSIVRGHRFGRLVGITIAVLAAIAALLDIPQAPLWSLISVGVCIWIIHGLMVSEPEQSANYDVRLGPSSATPVIPRPPM
jgi:hypothetical protein